MAFCDVGNWFILVIFVLSTCLWNLCWEVLIAENLCCIVIAGNLFLFISCIVLETCDSEELVLCCDIQQGTCVVLETCDKLCWKLVYGGNLFILISCVHDLETCDKSCWKVVISFV